MLYSPDHCPACDRRITDHDMTGCELVSGQRWCTKHLPNPWHIRCPECTDGPCERCQEQILAENNFACE